jgi:hypothetical protein
MDGGRSKINAFHMKRSPLHRSAKTTENDRNTPIRNGRNPSSWKTGD